MNLSKNTNLTNPWGFFESEGSVLQHYSIMHLYGTKCAFGSSFIHSFIYSFIHLVIRSFIHLFIHSYIHSFIHSFMHSLIHHVKRKRHILTCLSITLYSHTICCVLFCFAFSATMVILFDFLFQSIALYNSVLCSVLFVGIYHGNQY